MSNALDDLIAKVEAGGWLPSSVVVESPVVKWASLVHAAYDGSLDAALALHNAVLPGWIYNVSQRGYCHVFPAHDNGEQEAVIAANTEPARAWLLAILWAMKEGEQ